MKTAFDVIDDFLLRRIQNVTDGLNKVIPVSQWTLAKITIDASLVFALLAIAEGTEYSVTNYKNEVHYVDLDAVVSVAPYETVRIPS